MPVQPPARLSDSPAVGSLLFLPPDAGTARRIHEELAAAGVDCATVGSGLHVAIGDWDWRTLIDLLCEALPARGRRDTRVAIIPRHADERVRRKAVALPRSLPPISETFCGPWLYGLLQRNELRAHFQPLVHFPPGSVYGYE